MSATAQSDVQTCAKTDPSEADQVSQLAARVRLLEQQLQQLLSQQTPHTCNETRTRAQDAAQQVSQAPDSVPMGATRVVMHQIVAPSEIDALGICFGGQVLSWIDVCAGLAAKTLARGPCVTVSVDAVHFFRPCRLGDVVIIAAMVNRTFSSSMEVGVRVEAEEMATGIRRHCCSAYLTFVSLKAQQQTSRSCSQQQNAHTQPSGQQAEQQQQQQQPHKPKLPRLLPHTSEQRRIYAQAEARRQQRLAARLAAQNDPHRAALLKACRLRPVTHMEGGPTLPPPITLALQEEPRSSRRSSSSSLDRQSSVGTGELVSPRPPGAPATHRQQQVAGLDGAAGAAGPAGTRRTVQPGATSVNMTQSIMPHHANTLGITFGGQVLSWMEQCAYISASRLRGAHHLTASMDGVSFAAPTHVGDVMYIISEVTAIFDSSLEVMISVFGETPSAGKVFHCADAFATIVVVDAQEGRPSHIPFELQPVTEEEHLRLEGAQERRAERLTMRSALAAASNIRPSLDATTL